MRRRRREAHAQLDRRSWWLVCSLRSSLVHLTSTPCTLVNSAQAGERASERGSERQTLDRSEDQRRLRSKSAVGESVCTRVQGVTKESAKTSPTEAQELEQEHGSKDGGGSGDSKRERKQEVGSRE